MRIKRIELQNFKRFTDLVITDIPESSKLVLLIGSNGSGKSSLFDAFDWQGKAYKIPTIDPTEAANYYRKSIGITPSSIIEFAGGKTIKKTEAGIAAGHEFIGSFIGRSSIRIISKIRNSGDLRQVSLDQDSPEMYIENDSRFINDVFLYIQQIDDAIREPVFSGKQVDTLKIFHDSIAPLNDSLLKIFGGDEETTIQIAQFQNATHQSSAKLIFRKGESKINYDLLSHGEKQVVILLINFIVRQKYYEDAIIFIDEMDCHLNTALQSNLLDQIVTKWIPDSAQLWTASHALGFIDYARKSEIASIIDFDLLNFDVKQELVPLAKDNLDVYEIAIPKATIASILKGYTLVVVENKNDEYYNAALGTEGYLFLPANNNREVFLTVKADDQKIGLRDRDYLTTEEIGQIKNQLPNLKILSLYTFENYIYHPDNIAELGLNGFNKEEYIAEITKQKNERLIEIVSKIGTSRNHYIEFKDCIKNTENIKPITDAIQSDSFDTFYPHFNMKDYYNKKYLSGFKFTPLDLAKTNWFKEQIKNVLKS